MDGNTCYDSEDDPILYRVSGDFIFVYRELTAFEDYWIIEPSNFATAPIDEMSYTQTRSSSSCTSCWGIAHVWTEQWCVIRRISVNISPPGYQCVEESFVVLSRCLGHPLIFISCNPGGAVIISSDPTPGCGRIFRGP